MSRGLVLAAALALAGCATLEPIGDERFDDRYRITGVKRDEKRFVAIGYRLFERGGKTAICGVYTPQLGDQHGYDLNAYNLERGALMAGETKVVYDLTQFANAGVVRNFAGVQTRCLLTDLPWKPEYADAELRFEFIGPSGVVEI